MKIGDLKAPNGFQGSKFTDLAMRSRMVIDHRRGTTHVKDFFHCARDRDRVHTVEISMGTKDDGRSWGHMKQSQSPNASLCRNCDLKEVNRPRSYWVEVAKVYHQGLVEEYPREVAKRRQILAWYPEVDPQPLTPPPSSPISAATSNLPPSLQTPWSSPSPPPISPPPRLRRIVDRDIPVIDLTWPPAGSSQGNGVSLAHEARPWDDELGSSQELVSASLQLSELVEYRPEFLSDDLKQVLFDLRVSLLQCDRF
ncbi:hypothetical protein AAF712_016229 [Marasmius tenuissimus]|uniref:Uncharacterized protein n=1 Tax=Marasmius tenuissimus TaxID=585030 RepID=A0ABR2Z7B0_9AGAR